MDVRTALVVHDGRTGDTLTWAALLDRLRGADVIVIGEQHNDATGHAVQLAVVDDVLESSDGGGLALEMLERDEQPLVQDYIEGIIDDETFAKLTNSTNWSGTGSWEAWYQPVIDASIEHGGVVIAANAPRRYVRLARTDGWARLDEISDARSALVEHPDEGMMGGYRDRFIELMGGHGDDDSDDEEARAEAMETAESFFLAQQVWDATMAGSISEALKSSGPPVILLVGRFHSDHEGGTVLQLRRHHPAARIATISLEPECDAVEFDTSEPQADFIVCTSP